MKRRDFLAGAGAASAAALAGCTGDLTETNCGYDSTPDPVMNGYIDPEWDWLEVEGTVRVTAENPYPDVSFENLTVDWNVRRSDGTKVGSGTFTFGDLPADGGPDERPGTFRDTNPPYDPYYEMRYTYSYEYRCE